MAIDDVMVCMPWREQPDRLPAYNRVSGYWHSHKLPIVLADSGHTPFNLAASRNAAVVKAQTQGAKIVIVADADTIPEWDNVQLAIDIARRENSVVWPFDAYHYLGEADPEADTALRDIPVEKTWGTSTGGLIVCNTQTYWMVGGMDERFRQWGYEDNAFWAASKTLAHAVRLSGAVYAFGHEADRDLSDENPGKARMALYSFAKNKPAVMRELLL